MDLRITEHPILDFLPKNKVSFLWNGQEMWGYEGEPIAAALLASGVKELHTSLKTGRPRGFFCAIGNCSSCLVVVDGVPNVRACTEKLRAGMRVERQAGAGPALAPRAPRVPGDVGRRASANSVKGSPAIKTTPLAIVGAGPAGVCAALEAASCGVKVTLIDRADRVGGQLVKQTHKFFGWHTVSAGTRGFLIAEKLGREVSECPNITFVPSTEVIGYYGDAVLLLDGPDGVSHLKCDKLIVATGAAEKTLLFPGNDLPGVYGAGAVQTLMNVDGIRPGRSVLMVGSGNIGLIVSYQLAQAGVQVKAIVEALPSIGGYAVHASKVRRLGIPILTRHSIKRVYGSRQVQGATVWRLDSSWNGVSGSEVDMDVDTVCLATGLSPLSELLWQSGVKMVYVPELGGFVPVHDEDMETTVEGVYAAGDAAGIEEASTAMAGGRLAGLSAAASLGAVSEGELVARKNAIQAELSALRSGPASEKVVKGLLQVRAACAGQRAASECQCATSAGQRDASAEQSRVVAEQTAAAASPSAPRPDRPTPDLLLSAGIPSGPQLAAVTPPGERRRKGPCAMVECFQRIPCDPCAYSCRFGAFKEFEDINDLPAVDWDKCTGCGLCVAACPGLAIFVIDESIGDDKCRIAMPYEFSPLPEAGQEVSLLDREGLAVGRGAVRRVAAGRKPQGTAVVWVDAPHELSLIARGLRVRLGQ